MNVTVGTAEDFVECLSAAPALFENAVRVNINRKQVKEGIYEVTFQASAMVRTESDELYLLRMGTVAGRDVAMSGGHTDGTDAAAKMKALIKAHAESRKWSVLPGVLGWD